MATFFGSDKASRLAYRTLRIPAEARLVPTVSGCAVYTFERGGKPYVMAFRGSAAKPEGYHWFTSDDRRQTYIAGFVASVASAKERKTSRQAVKSAWINPAKVGDILYTSWGYDQTNVEFYAVTKVSGKRVWVRPIAQDGESTGYMQSKVWPSMPIRFVGDETLHVARQCDTAYAVKISQSATAYLEQGRDHYSSSYA